MTLRKLTIFLAVLGVVLLFCAVNGLAANDSAFKILYINSYHRGYAWSDGIEAGLENKFRDAGRPFELSTESLDTKEWLKEFLD